MTSKNHKKMTKSYFDVLGICCTSEVPLIESILKSLDGIKEYSVIVPSRTVIVVHDSLIISQLHIGNAFHSKRKEQILKNVFCLCGCLVDIINVASTRKRHFRTLNNLPSTKGLHFLFWTKDGLHLKFNGLI